MLRLCTRGDRAFWPFDCFSVAYERLTFSPVKNRTRIKKKYCLPELIGKADLRTFSHGHPDIQLKVIELVFRYFG